MTIALDPFAAPGRNRPAPTPAAVALLAQCKRAKSVADAVPTTFANMPAPAEASAAGGEVQLIVRPTCLSDWIRWTAEVNADLRRMVHTGTTTVVRCEVGGVRTRLIGIGVPALLSADARRTGVRRG
ncbi:hypothetical protein ACFVIY_37775 [Streptomyces sp. NPDC127166]|uniref:hypothetical protein n=1 Tax=Streptomyces sp. NPDC127166 TaxID=3345380 RepID=UPI00363567F6